MKIAFDAKRIFFNYSGLGNYSRNTLEILTSKNKELEFLLYTPKTRLHQDLKFMELYANIQVKTPTTLLSKLFNFLWRIHFINNQLEKDQVDIYHGLSNELPFGLKNKKIKSVVTIHDLIFLRYPFQYKLVDRIIYNIKSKYACNNADKIIAISEQTKNDIINYYGINPKKINVVYQSCHSEFKKEVSISFKDLIKEKYNLPTNFILYVGSIVERKNLLTILKSLVQLDKYELVVVGKGNEYKKKCEDFIKQYKLKDRVHFLNIEETTELAAIYQIASIMIYPSVFEGFGIPIIEALYSKTPVITTKGGCFSEAGGPSSIYIDPTNVSQLTDAILRIMNQKKLRCKMAQDGYKFVQKFSTQLISDKISKIYANL